MLSNSERFVKGPDGRIYDTQMPEKTALAQAEQAKADEKRRKRLAAQKRRRANGSS